MFTTNTSTLPPSALAGFVARPRIFQLTLMFVRHGLLLASVGAGFGLVAALGLGRVMSSLLSGSGRPTP